MSESAQQAKGSVVRYAMLDRTKFPDLEMNVPEIALLWGVGDEQVRVWAREGTLPGVRAGKEWRFSWADFDELKRHLREQAATRAERRRTMIDAPDGYGTSEQDRAGARR